MDGAGKPIQSGQPRASELLGLDVFSADGQLVGRVAGFAGAPDNDATTGLDRTTLDTVSWQASLEEAQRVLVDGSGYIMQALISVPIDRIDFDLRGRRATLRLTMAEIERIPRRDPNAGALPAP